MRRFGFTVGAIAGAMKAVAQQVDGHPEVVIKNKADATGSIVAKVPNGQLLTVLGDHGDYVGVRWNDIEGFARANNLARHTEVGGAGASASSATNAKVTHPGEGGERCSTPGCGKPTWNGCPGEKCRAPPERAGAPERTGIPRTGSAEAESRPAVVMTAVARQVDGHPDVVLKDEADSRGSVVAKVPNGELLTILDEYGAYSRVRWKAVEGYSRTENLSRPPAR